MEPLLELSDRITATLWEFLRSHSDGDRTARVADDPTEIKLRREAANDYARLQTLLDLWDPRGSTGDPNAHPLDWVFKKKYSFIGLAAATANQNFKIEQKWERLKRKLPERFRKTPIVDEPKDQPATDIEAAAKLAIRGLMARINRLEDIWLKTREGFFNYTESTMLLKKAALHWQGPPETGYVSLLAYSTFPVGFVSSRDESHSNLKESVLSHIEAPTSSESPTGGSKSYANSDELFDRIARWLSSRFVSMDDRVALATIFLQSPLERYPDFPPFLIQSAIEDRISDIRSAQRNPFAEDRWQDPGAHCKRPDALPPAKAADEWGRMEPPERLKLLLDRKKLRDFCKRIDVPVPFSLVLSDEFDEIRASQAGRLNRPTTQSPSRQSTQNENQCAEDPLPQHDPLNFSLFGVGLSGGGIRSATFALGLFQAMADRNILPYIDLLSCVSGGGYFASFLIAWIKRRGGVRSVQHSLSGFASDAACESQNPDFLQFQTLPPDPLPANQDPRADHLRPIRLLREYGRYLAPEDGLFSADTWTIFATWLRNTSLNFIILTFFLSGLLLLPRVAVFVTYSTRGMPHYHLSLLKALVFQRILPQWLQAELRSLPHFMHSKEFLAGFLAGIPFAIAGALIGRWNLRTFDEYKIDWNNDSRGWSNKGIVRLLTILIFPGALFGTVLIWNTGAFMARNSVSIGFACVSFLSFLVMIIASTRSSRIITVGLRRKFWERLACQILSFAISCLVAGFLMVGFCFVLSQLDLDSLRGTWIAIATGPPMLTFLLAVTIVLMQGLAGRTISEEQREWWGRLGAWLFIFMLAWLGISCICFFAPLWMLHAGVKISAAGITWATITAAGARLAYSPTFKGSQSGQSQPFWQNWILGIAPPVFVIGLLCALSFLLFLFVGPLLIWANANLWSWLASFNASQINLLCCSEGWFNLVRLESDYWPLMNLGSGLLMVLPGLFFMISTLIAGRVDVNLFSMHHFYRNRLVRAYLGASRVRAHREPNAFTGFDMQDDLYLHRLIVDDPTNAEDLVTDCRASYCGPYPILNTALNVTKGQDLGLQQRRAESFVFTPLWSGFDFMRKQSLVRKTALEEFGFRRTCRFGGDGAFVGTAMAISGAAFSSNAGYHTSPPLAFLLTVFGVRLGWWAGNPRKKLWNVSTPRNSLSYLTDELTANTTTDREFVLLTDGGHFENMGLYELIRRRCRYIIVVDAEQDEEFKLEGIGGAIRKCRDDFGVVIDLALDPLRPVGDPQKSQMHCSIGSVRYPEEAECAILVYIKASLTGDESVDLVEFAESHPDFPHTPTSNQMFDEDHFESYRQLGHHIGSKVFQRNWLDSCENVIAEGFREIEEGWKFEKEQMEAKQQNDKWCKQPASAGSKKENAQ